MDFVYGDLAPNYRYRQDMYVYEGLWLIRLLPGNGTSLTQQVRFTKHLNHTSQPYQAVVQNFELDHRIYLDQQMRPLALILVSGMLAVVFGFPLFLRSTLVSPHCPFSRQTEAVICA